MEEPLHIRRDRLLKEIAEKHGLSVADITGLSRKVHIITARHEWFYRARKELNISLPAIGRRTGFRDHSTVLHGVHKHARLHGLTVPKIKAFKQRYAVPLDAPLSQPDWWNDD